MDQAVCWQCGGAAEGDCTFVKVLEAPTRRGLDAQGFDVKRGRFTDTIRVPVPRCRACRSRSRISMALVFGGLAVGVVVGWTVFGRIAWAPVAGAVLGFLIPIVALVVVQRGSGRRAIDAYPPVWSLKAAGWTEPSSD